MKKYVTYLMLFYVLPVFSKPAPTFQQAVTYETSTGRFGDNLLSYMHAKWIAYLYNLPLLYKPFVYSDQLKMHQDEFRYSSHGRFKRLVRLGKHQTVNPNDQSSILYFVPYFPESKWERATGISFSGGRWDYIEVDWDDKGFIEYLRKTICPINPIKNIPIPEGCISVAVHVRRGGNYDPSQTIRGCPLKFLPDEFFISSIQKLYDLFGKQPLYVHIFTDDHNPEHIASTFKEHLKGLNITFGYRTENNSETQNVIEDFFAMAQFDCLIHSESNYSLTMSKIGDFLISMYPDSFTRKNNQIIYNHVDIHINREKLNID